MSRIPTYRKNMLVQRFHAVPMIWPETVGHHSANVALICMEICDRMGVEIAPSLLKAALLHDVGEYYTGDIPSNVKWAYEDFNNMLAEIERDYLFNNNIHFPELTFQEEFILKTADILDLCLKCKAEFRMGNEGAGEIHTRALAALEGQTAGAPFRSIVWEIYSEC